jgi:hypothetical protein
MNERIKQLATEVGISVEYLNNTKQWPLIEALAELIVEECCAIADQVERADMDSYASKYIRAHFGVE